VKKAEVKKAKVRRKKRECFPLSLESVESVFPSLDIVFPSFWRVEFPVDPGKTGSSTTPEKKEGASTAVGLTAVGSTAVGSTGNSTL
jgi:hypothetical protein